RRVRPVDVADVRPCGQVGGRGPRLLGRPGVQAGQPGAARPYDHGEAQLRCLDHRGGAVDDRPDRGDPTGADDVVTGDQGADTVGEVDDVRAAHAREEVLVAAGEADDLVGEDRPAHEYEVGVDDEAVDPYVDGAVESPAAQPADLLGGDRA